MHPTLKSTVKHHTKRHNLRQLKYFIPLIVFVVLSGIFYLLYSNAISSLEKKDETNAFTPVPTSQIEQYYVPVVHYTDKRNDISQKELQDLFTGVNKDYTLYLSSEDESDIEKLLDLPKDGENFHTEVTDNEVINAVVNKPASLSILPFYKVNFRVKSLSVGGKYLWDKSMINYPLKLTKNTNNKNELNNKFTQNKVTLLTNVGDVILGRHVAFKMKTYNDYTHPWLLMAELLKKADITFADLETPLSDRVAPPDEGMSFITPKKAIEGLKLAGIDIVALANNHSTNYGTNPFLDTLQTLKDNNIKYVGGGANLAEAEKPEIIEKNGLKFAFLDYNSIIGALIATDDSPGVAKFAIKPWTETDSQQDIQKIKTAVSNAKKQADIVVLQLHWGVEYKADPIQSQINVAHAAVDSGADLIVGTHPHIVAGMENYDGVPIFYSLGNFIFDQEWSTETKQGTIAQTYFYDNKLVSAPLIPYQIEDYNQPHPATAAQSDQILSRIFGASLSSEFKN
jgi:poly-gamma-glutamate capsule biosynthesis protein CapA/YwtB (metallophosphatase superfamily)